MVEALVREERLVRVLADETAEGPDVHAVCAPGRRTAARVRAALDILAESFAMPGR